MVDTIGTSYIGDINGSNGFVSHAAVANQFGVRPVISLKNGVLVNSNGDGTRTNPYVVI